MLRTAITHVVRLLGALALLCACSSSSFEESPDASSPTDAGLDGADAPHDAPDACRCDAGDLDCALSCAARGR